LIGSGSIKFGDNAFSTHDSQQSITYQTQVQQLQTKCLETVETKMQLITEKAINKIEEITEESDKIFSSAEKPILGDEIGQGGFGEVYRGK
jgi:ABC-type Mn2+/Zn2+ transport system ATPase subunit